MNDVSQCVVDVAAFSIDCLRYGSCYWTGCFRRVEVKV